MVDIILWAAANAIRWKMEEDMRADLKPGNQFPDIELPDTSGTVVKLSDLMKGLPTVLTFNRGKY